MKAQTKNQHLAREKEENTHMTICTEGRAIKSSEIEMRPGTTSSGKELKRKETAMRKSTIKRKERSLPALQALPRSRPVIPVHHCCVPICRRKPGTGRESTA